MNTREIMAIALKLAGLEETPADSAISVEGENIQKVLFGVDMETAELMLAKSLGYDLVISHHPKADQALINFHEVMDIQIKKMASFGVPVNKAQKALRAKKNTVDIGHHVLNYDRVSSAARLLGMPFMNIHMPADLIGERYVQRFLDDHFEANPFTKLSEVVNAIVSIDSYSRAVTKPVIRCGSPDDYAGKIAVLYAGGTNGGEEVYKAYFEAGVGTIVAMHAPENVIEAVRAQNIGNIIVAGHMASDSIGIQIIIKALEEKGLNITPFSGVL
jgi:putative NIF3 family GTP cyclohydrolase 1 type 2